MQKTEKKKDQICKRQTMQVIKTQGAQVKTRQT